MLFLGILLNLHLILSDVLIPCFKSVQRQLEEDHLHCLALHKNLLPHALIFLNFCMVPLLIPKVSLLSLLRPYASV